MMELIKKNIVLSLCLVLGAQVVVAQGNGPTQPEVTSFQPIGTSGLVNPSTGDFSYSIPLFEVGGYPISMSYSAGRTMDEQASNVGLGWNLNCGMITRNMRGVPDDFSGDIVTKRFNMKENNTFGVNFSFLEGSEVATFKIPKGMSLDLGVDYNTYRGIGTSVGLNLSTKIGKGTSGNSNLKLGFKSSSVNGLSANATLSSIEGNHTNGLGLSMDARDGLGDLTLSRITKIEKTGYTSSKSYTFAQSTYVPYSSLPIVNFAFTGSFKPGFSWFFLSPQVKVSAFVAIQKLRRNHDYCAAYGTMYLQNGNTDAMLDMNREKDGAVTEISPSLDIPFNTPDIFSLSGHGFSGSFQLKRGDVGFLYDKFVSQASGSASYGIETSPGNAQNGEMDITLTPVISNSGKWEMFNALSDECRFRDKKDNSFKTESAYFRSSGESTLHDAKFADRLLGLDLARPAIDNMTINNEFTHDGSSNTPVNGPLRRETREKRNELLTHLTAEEASNVGVDKYINSYEMNKFLSPQVTSMLRYRPDSEPNVGQSREKHHISEVTAVKDDGLRYVFGLPAYNWTQKEISFNVGGNSVTQAERTVEYSGVDKSTENAQGLDRYFMETTTPAFAHSFFLTNVLSPEYQDRRGDGATPDDLGDYVKFRYTRAYEKFRWRTPNAQNRASHSEGSLVHGDDDKGTITYGEKEYWYVHSMESKTHVAEFHYVVRKDLKGVQGEDGGYDASQPMHAVDYITLYSLPDRLANGANAVPVKRIYFEYNYELYTGLPGHTNPANAPVVDNGKLTLKRVSFANENSDKGTHSAYSFEYNKLLPGGSPLVYKADANNCWGGYKLSGSGTLTNEDFPYIAQQSTQFVDAKATEDAYSGLGNLSVIRLPSGGKISVAYESDDYAYVQDKTAMNFFKIERFVSAKDNSAPLLGNELWDYSATSNHTKNRLTFRLKRTYDGALPSSVANQQFFGDYLAGALTEGSGYLTLKNVVDLDGSGSEEWIKTFSKVDGYGVSKSSNLSNSPYDMGFIDLEEVCMDASTGVPCIPGSINPIRLAAFQELRMNHPRLAYSLASGVSPDNITFNLFMSLFQHLANVVDLFTGPNPMLHNKRFARTVDLERSFVRLNVPDGQKLGGGHRVKSISITDEFGAMVPGQTSSTYTTLYDYTMDDDRQRNFNKRDKISSGVAEYEPMVGGEENPFKQPEMYNREQFLRINNRKFIEHPMGESFMPSANVVYSRVKIKSEVPTNASNQANGSQIQEFYTAKDFPISVSKTRLGHLSIKGFIWALVVSGSVDLATFSQGFLVEQNDMHGKPKSTIALDNKGNTLSSTRNFYKTQPGNSKKLDNSATVIKSDGSLSGEFDSRGFFLSNAQIGIDFQAHLGCRSADDITIGATLGFDVNLTVLPLFIPIPIAIGRPDFSGEFDMRAYRSTSMLKVIRRNGLLDKVEAREDGASVFTENLAYDAETGGVLLTKTTNEFKDPIYNLTMPAHWVYPEMGLAYRNIRGYLIGSNPNFFDTKVNTNVSGVASLIDASALTIGDILHAKVTDNFGVNRVQKIYIKEVNANMVTLVNEEGSLLANASIDDCFVMRSGYTNTPSAPVQTIMSLVDPINYKLGRIVINENTAVVNAAATEYERKWQHNCTDCYFKHSAGKNFFADNYFGHWRPKLSWAFAGKRKGGIDEASGGLMNTVNGLNKNLRQDGMFDGFVPFWRPSPGAIRKWERCAVFDDYYVGPLLPALTGAPLAENWVRANQVTKVHPQGNSIESRNALNLYSAQALGYMNTQVIAEAQNAKYNQIGFEGFEDLIYEIRLGTLVNNSAQLWNYYNPLCGRHLVPRFFGLDTDIECLSEQTFGRLFVSPGHTGEYAVRVADDVAPIHYKFEPDNCQTSEEYTSGDYPVANTCDCTSEVSLTSGKYVLSAWVKPEDKDCTGDLPNEFAQLELFYMNNSNNGQSKAKFSASGEAVEGWKRIYAVFDYDKNTDGTIGVRVIKDYQNGVLMDDFRIHPFDASFKSYVYDEKLLKLTYELDANNYFTKYEYDQQGMLERIKKETERGVMMVKESRYGGRKD